MHCFLLVSINHKMITWIITPERAFLFGDRIKSQSDKLYIIYSLVWRKFGQSYKRYAVNRSVCLISVSPTQNKCSSHFYEICLLKKCFWYVCPRRQNFKKMWGTFLLGDWNTNHTKNRFFEDPWTIALKKNVFLQMQRFSDSDCFFLEETYIKTFWARLIQ